MNRLKGALSYFVGPMDQVPDMGADWRENMSHFLWDLGCGVLNPCDKPTDYAKETQETRTITDDLKKRGRQATIDGDINTAIDTATQIVNIMKPIVNIDLRMVDIAHFIVMNIDIDYHMTGSYNEQTIACLQRKPIIIHCKQGKWSVPNWLWGTCRHELFFDTWEQVKNYILHIHNDKVVNDLDRFRFFDYDKVFGRNQCQKIT